MEPEINNEEEIIEEEVQVEESAGNDRVALIEKYLLDPEKTIFEMLADFGDSVEEIRTAFKGVDVGKLEMLKGVDGYTPERGVDYMTDADFDVIEEFITERLPVVGVDIPSIDQVNGYIDSKTSVIPSLIDEKVAEIPRVKGDKGDRGDDGSPDSPKEVLEKLRSLGKNQGLMMSDVRGLVSKINLLNETAEDLQKIREEIDNIRIVISPGAGAGDGGPVSITGLIEEGTNITITGTGTADDPYIINSVGSGSGDVSSNTASSVDGEIALFSGITGKEIKRATGTGITKITSGVLSVAVLNTDYANVTTRLDQFAVPTASLNLNSQKIINLLDPTNAQDAVTKAYMDNAITGLTWKTRVRVATTTNGTLATAYENGDTIDGVVLVTGDRILIKNQTDQKENGIYVVNASGTPTRSEDANTGPELVSATMSVSEGTVNQDTQWTCNNNSITIGVTNITFVQISGAGTYTNGTGITLTGNVFAIDTAVVVTITGTQTLTNKTLTSPAITTGTYTGTQLLNEGASIGYDPSLSSDGTWTGITITATAGYTQAFGDLVYVDPTDSRWEATDANAAAGADGDARGILGMVVVAGTDGNPCTILLNGVIRADANFPTFTVNNPIYVSETAGDVTQTQPTTTDVVIRVVGFALTADSMYFNPSSDYITRV